MRLMGLINGEVGGNCLSAGLKAPKYFLMIATQQRP
jgi:hypothetical protein